MSFRAAEWTTKYINDLPDSAFAFIAPGGKKDAEGKTVPRTLRNLPYKDANGKIDLPHLRNAMARVTHTNLSKDQQKRAHDVLLRAYMQVGMSHPLCSVSGCKGYEPSEKKSMLCDVEGFQAFRESWLQTNNERAIVSH
jgi:hypothetical protein